MSVTLDIENIQWVAVADQLPDADTTVLVNAPGSDEPVWLGYYDGFDWFAIGGEGYGDPDEIAAAVIAWAVMPAGPG